MVLRHIFGPKTKEVTRYYRKLHIEELQDLKSSTNNIQVMKPRSRLPRHVAHRGNDKMNIGFWWGNLTKKHYLEDLRVIRE